MESTRTHRGDGLPSRARRQTGSGFARRGRLYSGSTDLVVESPSLDEMYVDPDAVEQHDGLWRVHAGWYDGDAKVVKALVAVFGDPGDGCKTWDAAWDAVAPGPRPPEDLRRLLPPGTLTLADIKNTTGREAHEVLGTVFIRPSDLPDRPSLRRTEVPNAVPNRLAPCLTCSES